METRTKQLLTVGGLAIVLVAGVAALVIVLRLRAGEVPEAMTGTTAGSASSTGVAPSAVGAVPSKVDEAAVQKSLDVVQVLPEEERLRLGLPEGQVYHYKWFINTPGAKPTMMILDAKVPDLGPKKAQEIPASK